MDLSLFDYHLPSDLIAQIPPPRRDESRLLLVERPTNRLEETTFQNLDRHLQSGDLLVFNDTKVFPARLQGKKEPGGAAIEMLLLHPSGPEDWEVIAYRASRLKEGTTVVFSEQLACEVRECLPEGKFRVRFSWQGDWDSVLDKHGSIPLPPYIRRDNPEWSELDRQRYQTVYARHRPALDSAAAPTAGLHFTPELLERLQAKGIETATVTLRVGLDTFLPMRVDRVEEHRMHSETYRLPAETARQIENARRDNRRVVAVGTTSVRVLESAAEENGALREGEHSTRLFIYPGYRFRIVEGLITNFHLPKSTLLLLVSAFMGNDLRQNAYRFAIDRRFRFYSYGDAMLIL